MIRLLLLLGILACIPLCTGVADDPAPVASLSDAITLPPPEMEGPLSLEEAIAARRSIRSYSSEPLSNADLSSLLWAAQGITDASRGYRAAPSAGALYPLEVTVAIGDVEGIAPGTYRYHPDGHRIILIEAGDHRAALSVAATGQQSVADAPATLVISGVYDRLRVRYGDRAERYTILEAGHASQNCYLIATSRGLGTVAVGAFDEGEVQEIMGLPADETPLYLMPVGQIG